ncbi:MAG: DNA-3-methyladenine glycosylase I [Oscillospiraceae bacterium]|nr:DNA-3-methyladenine glycosylase I [Oscillospiraceae bacterium]
MQIKPTRCAWVNLNNPVYIRYHDEEWGRPCHDDRQLYELLILESFQAGLSWECVLNKRENFRRAFDGFDAAKVAAYGTADVERLLADAGIIRNRAKIRAVIGNSAVFLQLQVQFGSFDRYLWDFCGNAVLWEPCDQAVESPLSRALSADLRRRGMRFVGSTILYSYLQAVGIIDGHTGDCFLCKKQKNFT